MPFDSFDHVDHAELNIIQLNVQNRLVFLIAAAAGDKPVPGPVVWCNQQLPAEDRYTGEQDPGEGDGEGILRVSMFRRSEGNCVRRFLEITTRSASTLDN